MRRSLRSILVFRTGSIGDFVISLPCLHFVRRRFSDHAIALLTNRPADSRAAPAESVLENSGLIDQYIYYPTKSTNLKEVFRLRRKLSSLDAELVVYLAPFRGLISTVRDRFFFQSCGLHRIVGLPGLPNSFLRLAWQSASLLCESEAETLGKRLTALGVVDLNDSEKWNLRLTSLERNAAYSILVDHLPVDIIRNKCVIGISIGTKQSINDWGFANWLRLVKLLDLPKYALIFIGGREDRQLSDDLGKRWRGPVLNLCGRITPRLSAAVIENSRLFVCHDSGPMHLAAAVGVSCVAIFSRNNRPGKWFPFGDRHKIFYPYGKGETIQSIQPPQVVNAINELLASSLKVEKIN